MDVQEKRPPSLWEGEAIDAPFEIMEEGVRYLVDFNAGYSQGLFLDQRDNRAAVRRRSAPGSCVLNCFAYTCAFSVAAALADAQTVSVDLSNAALNWGKENFRLNGLDPAPGSGHEFHAGDVFDFLRRFEKKGRRFHLIVLDPPTFSRDRQGRVFRAERDFGRLAAAAARVLEDGGEMFCSTNARGLTPRAFERLLASGLPSEAWRFQPAPMPADFTGSAYLQAGWARHL